METTQISKTKGGEFIIKSFDAQEIFTPEDFSEEQMMMKEAVQEFIDREVIPNRAQFEKKDYALTQRLMAKAGELGFLVAGLAGKFVEHAVDTYINPEGLSFLIKNSSESSKIPEPSPGTLLAGIFLMKFDTFGSFHVDLESDGEKIPVHFRRIGFKWKVKQIEFSDDLINRLIHK